MSTNERVMFAHEDVMSIYEGVTNAHTPGAMMYERIVSTCKRVPVPVPVLTLNKSCLKLKESRLYINGACLYMKELCLHEEKSCLQMKE